MTRLHDQAGNATIADVEYRVLGPLSAHLDGVAQRLGGRRQRTVLAVLVASANTVVGQDALIDAVWAGEPPESARQTLHTYVSTLRKALGGQIERDGDGYLLRIERSNLDSFRFEDLVDSARPIVDSAAAEAIAMLQEALGMWRGRAFGDLDGEPALSSEVSRLDEARLSALELRIRADLVLGNHAAVVQELEALTREYPFRERLRADLMLALYRSGRQADALRVYQQTRTFLAEELGIDPTHELQELEEQILNHDPGLDWTPVAGESSRGGRAARGYELREELGRSSFGSVFRGFQNSVGREVTVLAIDPEAARVPRFVRRFESEMQAMSRMEHPHIAPIYDFWRDPEGAFIVIPYLAGGSLRRSLESGPWNLSSTMRLIDQVSSALTYAHRNGVVHGALGLDNIVLDEGANAYLCEFGLVDLAGLDAPRDRGEAGDVHDLALVSFAALTATASPPTGRIGETRPDLVALDHVFQRALHADPRSRYQKPGDFRRALRQVAGGDVITPSPDLRAEVERRNPFKGLRAFHESDAADFYGRDALTEELVEMVAAALLVTVVGPSGSGKSSLVRAGLIPALRQDAIPGSRNWLITEMFPGTHPFEELEAALVRVAVDRPPGFFEDLTADERGLARVAKQILAGEDDELILVIDQFEELFSLVSSESVRSRFLGTLVAAATDERSRIRILLTLRADFFDQPLRYSDFAEVMRLNVLPVGPPTDDGLARAIAQPARDVGVDLEPGLVTRIVDDVRDEPGGLPLMQYALTELFAARKHETLTLDGYHRTGGVLGALGRRAEEIYQHLSDEGKEATRHLFLRLVSVDELADDTRRRVRQTELRSLGINPMVLDDVLQQFGAYRLLSFDRDGATRTPTIEVAHEALIREWPRLRTWIDERREDLLIHRRIQVAVRDWEDSDKDPSDLLRGSRLEQALVWQERTDIAISEDEMTFIEAGIETERREEAEHLALEEKAARRRKAVIGVLAGGLVVAGVLGAFALDRAQAERVAAAEAFAQELSATAMLAVEEDAELGILLSLEAIEATEALGLDPVPEAVSALRNTVPQMRVTDRLEEGDHVLTLSPDGSTIAGDRYTEDDGVSAIALMDAATADVTYMIDPPVGSTGFIRDLAFSPSGDLLASIRASDFFTSPQAVSALDLYDLVTRRYLMTLAPESEAGLWHVSFGSGGLVAAGGGDGTGSVYVWDAADGGEVFGRSSASVRGSEFVPGTEILLIGEAPGEVEAVNVRNDEVLWSFETTIEPQLLAVSPDGSLLAISDPYASRSVQVMSLPDGDVLFTTSHQDPQGLEWSPDGAMLAVTGNDGDVTLLGIPGGGRSLVLSGHQAGVTSVAFLPDSRHVATASFDGQPRVWSIAAEGSVIGRAVALAGSPVAHTMSPDGGRLFVLMLDTGSTVLDLATGAVGPTFPVGYRNPLRGVVDASFTRLAGTDDDQDGQLFDLVSGGRILTFDPPCLSPRAISPDASLVLVDRFALCADEPGPNGVIEPESGELVLDLGRREVLHGVFGASDEGREFVVVSFFATVEAFWLDSGEILGSLSAEEVGAPFLIPSLSSDGRYLGVGTQGPRAVVVDMERVLTGTAMGEALLLNIEAHKGNAPIVSVTADGVAISAGFDGFYRAWDVDTGQKLWEIQVVGLETPPSISFNTDETELIYGDADGVLRFTPLDTEQVVAQARAALTRDLTDDECRQYLNTDGCEEPGS
jgi:DNA-binding SARP family transcriptional activator/WD40 repeat protein